MSLFIQTLRDVDNVIESLNQEFTDKVSEICNLIEKAVKEDRGIFIVGNGGSAADAQHFAAELVVKYDKVRRPIKAEALTTDTSIITACANDFDYESIFSRQLAAKAQMGDILIALTTSGNSPNVLTAMYTANELLMDVVLLTGRDGGEAAKRWTKTNATLIVPSNKTSIIQTVHQMIYHTICEHLDNVFSK